MKHRRQEPGSGVSSSRSNSSRTMRGRIPKVPKFSAFSIQHNTHQVNSQSEFVLPQTSASPSALQQVTLAQRRKKDHEGQVISRSINPHLYRCFKRYRQLRTSYPRRIIILQRLENYCQRRASLASN